MNYIIEKNRNLQDFGKITCGTLFLDEDNIPYIKTFDFSNNYGCDCDYIYIYNSICLATGGGRNFQEDKKVNVPNDYELKIFA